MTNPPPPAADEAQQPARRRRPPPRRVAVTAVSRLTPRLVSVELGGEALAGFAIEAPTSHIKVFLPAEGQATPVLPAPSADGPVPPDGAPRPVMRTYTPRRFDPRTNTLEVQFVLHGPGPASTWAQHAKIGDELGIAGPGGRFRLDPAAERWWIAGDESAIPAVATLLEALPATATAEVHLEVEDGDDEIPLHGPAATTITWHHRGRARSWGEPLLAAVESSPPARDALIWVACEATAVREIRKHLLRERQVPAASLTTRGYWRIGEDNHPDHDYGEDA